MTETINSEVLKMDLEKFTGTNHYYSHKSIGGYSLLLTDGCKYLREKAQCYWLFDLICSLQKQLSKETFQTWSLKKSKSIGWIIVATDGNDRKLATQYISYSDFPIEEGITIFLIDGVALLPSEN